MNLKEMILLVLGLSLIAALVLPGFAQSPTAVALPVQDTPVPRTVRIVWAQMTGDNESLELLIPAHQHSEASSPYDVNVPIVVEGKKTYRTERRERKLATTHVRFAQCQLGMDAITAYEPNGSRLPSQELSNRLAKPTLVILSDEMPDDMMEAVIADNCIVIVVPDKLVTFQFPNNGEK